MEEEKKAKRVKTDEVQELEEEEADPTNEESDEEEGDEEEEFDEEEFDEEEFDEEEFDEEEEAAIMDLFTGGLGMSGMLKKVMQEDGPVINLVVLRADGSIEDLEVDMTPRNKPIQTILGGPMTFIGTIESLEVVIICLRDSSLRKDLPKGEQKLPAPFRDDEEVQVVRGDIVLMKTGEEGEPQDFSVKEWEAYLASSVDKGEGDTNVTSSSSTKQKKDK